MIAAAFAALALLALLAVLLPLLRGGAAGPERAEFDRAVYRDQIRELDRDEARFTIGPAEAASARLEIQRRLLGREDIARPAGSGRNPSLALVLALLAASGAGMLYLSTGAPDLPAQPFASRAVDPQEAELRRALAELEYRVTAEPANGQAWLLLARTRAALGQWRGAEAAYRRALPLVPPDPDLLAAALEATVLAADGIVAPAAAESFARVLAEDPQNPIARFYLAAADAQAGRHPAAIAAWQALAAELPVEASIRAEIARRIATTAQAAGIAAPPLAPPAAPPDPIARAAMIQGMVDRLAARLEETPDDAEGWLRLGRAYTVLGEHEKAARAYASAGALRPDDHAVALAEAQALLEGMKPADPFPPRALALLHRVLAAEPNAPAALWHLGVEAAKRGAMAEAVALWDRLIAVLPPDGDDARVVRAAIAAVRRP